jgi:hypothetical protein
MTVEAGVPRRSRPVPLGARRTFELKSPRALLEVMGAVEAMDIIGDVTLTTTELGTRINFEGRMTDEQLQGLIDELRATVVSIMFAVRPDRQDPRSRREEG